MKNKIMHFFFLSCLKATELIEKKFHFKLSFTEKVQLEMHKMMCDACKTYEKQSGIIEKGLTEHHHEHQHEMDLEDLKKQIQSKLSQSSN
ncbi:MAG: hypothetical protein JW761_02605 [Prolixibacteraceae bacterium]|nr:hypothetical protein [Prolixibacteraceae bacterium]